MQQKVLFLCTGNSARSQMGEALLRAHGGERFQVCSAGTEPKNEIFPPVIEVMREIGIDISSQKPKSVQEYLGKVHFSTVIVVCGDADRQCPRIFGPAKRLFWPLEDPAAVSGPREAVLKLCRRVRDELDERICAWLGEQGIPARPFSQSNSAILQ